MLILHLQMLGLAESYDSKYYTTVTLCWKHSSTQTFSFNTLLCGSLQNVLKVIEHDAFISCSGIKYI